MRVEGVGCSLVRARAHHQVRDAEHRVGEPCGFGIYSAGFRVQGAGCRVQGSGVRVQGSGFGVQGSGFRDQGSGFRVQGSDYVLSLRRAWDVRF